MTVTPSGRSVPQTHAIRWPNCAMAVPGPCGPGLSCRRWPACSCGWRRKLLARTYSPSLDVVKFPQFHYPRSLLRRKKARTNALSTPVFHLETGEFLLAGAPSERVNPWGNHSMVTPTRDSMQKSGRTSARPVESGPNQADGLTSAFRQRHRGGPPA